MNLFAVTLRASKYDNAGRILTVIINKVLYINNRTFETGADLPKGWWPLQPMYDKII
jgi:hypothetical protein